MLALHATGHDWRQALDVADSTGSLPGYSRPMLICSRYLHIIADALTFAGHDGALAQRRCGLSAPQDGAEPDWVDIQLLDRMVLEALAQTKDPGWGLVCGASAAWARLVPFASLAISAPNLRQHLSDVIRYTPLLLPRPELRLVEHRTHCELFFDPVACDPLARRFHAEARAMGLVSLLRLMGGPQGRPERVEFAHERPEYADRYQMMLGAPVTFGRKACLMSFHSTLLDLPQRGRDASMYALLKARAESSLAARRSDGGDVMQRLRNLLAAQVGQPLDMAAAARSLGLSERSLRRALAFAQVTFTALKHESQRSVAEGLLAAGELAVDQVASAAGFATPSSFFRAFKRWTGQTPAAWRAGLAAGRRPSASKERERGGAATAQDATGRRKRPLKRC